MTADQVRMKQYHNLEYTDNYHLNHIQFAYRHDFYQVENQIVPFRFSLSVPHSSLIAVHCENSADLGKRKERAREEKKSYKPMMG